MDARGTLVVVQAQRVNVALSEVKVSGGSVPVDLVDRNCPGSIRFWIWQSGRSHCISGRLVLHKDAIELLATNGK
jgi:hypothetical protein